MKTIQLTQGHFAIVDDEDFMFLSQYTWYFKPDIHGGYAVHSMNIGGKISGVAMHRIIMLATRSNDEIDHINGNKLDNRKSNLRFTDDRGNGRNKGLRSDSTSGFKGVNIKPGANRKWTAAISINGKRTHLGTFTDPIAAAQCYDAAALEHHGEFAKTNRALGLL